MKAFLLAALLLSQSVAAPAPVARPAPAPGTPAPQLVFTGSYDVEVGGQSFTRYELVVANAESYSEVLFAPSAELPPCGNNKQAARTWIDIFDGTGARIYGFCAIGKTRDLRLLWFALPRGATPPAQVYLEMTDRLLGQVYRSRPIPIPAPPKRTP
jgi:hypothetical protein